MGSAGYGRYILLIVDLKKAGAGPGLKGNIVQVGQKVKTSARFRADFETRSREAPALGRGATSPSSSASAPRRFPRCDSRALVSRGAPRHTGRAPFGATQKPEGNIPMGRLALILVVAIAAALGFYYWRADVETATPPAAQDAAEEATTSAGEAVDAAGDAARSAGEAIGEAAKSAADAVKDAAGTATEQVQQGIEAVGDNVDTPVGEAANPASEPAPVLEGSPEVTTEGTEAPAVPEAATPAN
jgi:hypothetical protein